MRKQELIHLHGLLAEVRSRYEEGGEEPLDLGEYESVGVHPTSIHRSKTAHKRAVFALTDELTDAMTDAEPWVVPGID